MTRGSAHRDRAASADRSRSEYHGQLYTVAVLGTVAMLWLAKQQRLVTGCVALVLRGRVRQYVDVLVLPLLACAREGWRGIAAAFVLALVVVNAPLVTNPHAERLLAPASNYGLWGYAMMVQHGPRLLYRLGIADGEAVVQPLNHTLGRNGAVLPFLWAVVFAVWLARRRPGDLAGIAGVGALGLLTWAYATRTAWRLARS